MSFKPEVIIMGESDWTGNAFRFGTYQEARASVNDLQSRWLVVSATRVAVSDDPVNYRWDNGRAVPVVVEVTCTAGCRCLLSVQRR
jgi:hypothetical protein